MPSGWTVVCLIGLAIGATRCSDITSPVFGDVLDGMPAAFGDFNSDELTDVFMLRKNGTTVEIFLAAEQEPLLRPSSNLSCTFRHIVVGVVPGDFDGDVFMDVLVITFDTKEKLSYAYVLWGGNGRLNCTNEDHPLIKMTGQPLALDYNGDMIIDLFGLDEKKRRTFWIFDQSRTAPKAVPIEPYERSESLSPISQPHSNAYLDWNNDFVADLVVTTRKSFEIWLGIEEGFKYYKTIPFPYNISPEDNFPGVIGQTLYLDVELTGKMTMLLPLCFDSACTNSTIMMYSGKWYNLQVNFRDVNNVLWGFVNPDGRRYTDTITLRGGDFNMDGYPDLLATLKSTSGKQKQSFFLENVACDACVGFGRKFQVKWQALNPFYNETAMAVFYDFYQDGILDVILVEVDKSTGTYRTAAFKNSLDYDANFVKVMVLTGRNNSMYPISPGSLGKKKRTYGTNLPGPSIAYLLVGGKSREWPQIIPNSQMVVIPNPIAEPWKWKAQLFVTPSKLILLSAAALTGTCGLISFIIVALYWKERREDKIERLQEAHRFHFDAM
ncbi:T-cell immunomodulatory protein [Dufourea novaeangliae]|uniref:T-cell immunomodulatory protein n=1 Tax=Dufourea novaeangliae TaxID=178035 RepID=A0A154P558_DUFNO|nr:T-cell immunomodulatory protein [Dufourea novaeangliae]